MHFCLACTRIDSLHGCACHWLLPGGNEVLGQVDADRCSCDSDMTVTCPVQLAADLDLSSWHLPDLIDLSALTADDRADQLQKEQRRGRISQFDGKMKDNADVQKGTEDNPYEEPVQ